MSIGQMSFSQMFWTKRRGAEISQVMTKPKWIEKDDE